MRVNIPDQGGDPLEFDWDPVTGAVSGPDGWWVDRMLALWDGVARFAQGDELAPNPRYSIDAMVLFLMAQGFDPPEELRIRRQPPECQLGDEGR